MKWWNESKTDVQTLNCNKIWSYFYSLNNLPGFDFYNQKQINISDATQAFLLSMGSYENFFFCFFFESHFIIFIVYQEKKTKKSLERKKNNENNRKILHADAESSHSSASSVILLQMYIYTYMKDKKLEKENVWREKKPFVCCLELQYVHYSYSAKIFIINEKDFMTVVKIMLCAK